jgi:choline kinase
MAGKGRRFLDRGCEIPKWLLQAHGKSLLEWSVDSLPLELCTNLIFVLLKEHETDYNASAFIKKRYGHLNLSFVELDVVTRGQAETAFKAKSLLVPHEPLLIYNIDTRFSSSTLKRLLQNNSIDGVLGAFKSTSDKFSFAKLDVNTGFVEKVTEKIPISDNALTGLYHFSKAEYFISAAEQAISNNDLTKGEFFIAPLYNQLIESGCKFMLDYCDTFDVLGTPNELDEFLNKDIRH